MTTKKRIKSVTILIILMSMVGLFWLPKEPVNTPVILADKQQQRDSNLPRPTSLSQTVKKKQQIDFLTSNESAALISKAYAAQLVYPPYSQPLKVNNMDRLHPNYFNPQKMIINDEGDSVSAYLSHYRYIYPEPIKITVEGANIENVYFSLFNKESEQYLVRSKMNKNGDKWFLEVKGKKNFPVEPEAKVIVNVDGYEIPIILALRYMIPIATITDFETPLAKGKDMAINANITTEKSGLYRVSANLFDANDQPVAHLVQRKKLTKGNKQITLKAHHSVLKGRESPFYLSTIMVELMSPSPGVKKRFGHSLISKFEINDFAVSSLDETPYQPTDQEIQRLELLQQIANGN